jgi:A/G-specific adenine glycosylase
VKRQPPFPAKLRAALLSFYRAHGRDLPWRRTRDPYAIWISEVMLQQTQVPSVLPRFAGFLRRFPNVASLAAAEEAAVCEAWAGLGYYRRARNLHRAARVIVSQLGGKIPDHETALKQLPGVGDYTAAAIASLAFAARSPAVDGNLVRVLSRVFALPGRASDPALVRRVREQARLLVDCEQPGDINQALMDIGATLCRPAAPDCPRCPLRAWCRACREERPTAYPGKKTKPARKILRMAFAWIERKGALLLEQRPLDGLWPGLWEPPSVRGGRVALGKRLGQTPGLLLAQVSHELTHRHVVANIYPMNAGRKPAGRWWKDPLAAPLSSLARKAISAAAKPPAQRIRLAARK